MNHFLRACSVSRSAMAGSASVLCLLSMTVLLAVGTTTLTAMSAKQAVLKRAVEVEQA